MTISAQQTQIASIGRPILETSRPRVHTTLCFYFPRWVYVVNIQSAEIVKSTLNALAAKLLNQFKFSLPVAGALMDAVSVLVPIIAQAAIRAKAVGAFLSASLASTGFSPAMGQITSLTTIPRAFVPTHWLIAILASIHALIIPNYFACERIENAQRQQRMFA